MNDYSIFARYYDVLTKNVDYQARSEYISGFFHLAGLTEDDFVLDLACGTGSMTKCFQEKEFSMTGLDRSEEMLTQAVFKCRESTFCLGDMRYFDYNETFDACICCLDSLNHLNAKEDWLHCFESVAKSLRSEGLFIFDVNTVYKHQYLLADHSFIFDEDEYFIAWDNEAVDDRTVQIFLDFFVKEEEYYQRYSESFYETAFTSDEIREMLNAYFEVTDVFDDMTTNPERADSERLYFICRRK